MWVSSDGTGYFASIPPLPIGSTSPIATWSNCSVRCRRRCGVGCRFTDELPPGRVALDEWGQAQLSAPENHEVRMRLLRKHSASDPGLSGGG